MTSATESSRGSPDVPLTALLSQALVAFTIEFDNEAERHITHWTTRGDGARRGVWLASMAMWLNCMRYVTADPMPVGELARLARCDTSTDGMRRWGYVSVTRSPADRRVKPPPRDLLIAATERGQRAKEPSTAAATDPEQTDTLPTSTRQA